MATVNLFLNKLFMKEVYHRGFCKLVIQFASKQCKIVQCGRHEGQQAFQVNKTTLSTCPLFMRSSRYHVLFWQQFVLTGVVFPLRFSIKIFYGDAASDDSVNCRFKDSFTTNHIIERAEQEVRVFRVPFCLLNYSVLAFTMGCQQNAASFKVRSKMLLHDDFRAEMLLKDRLAEQACFARFINDGSAQAIVECRTDDGAVLPKIPSSANARVDWVHYDFGFEDFRVCSVAAPFVSVDEWCASSGLCERLKAASAGYKRGLQQVVRKNRTSGCHIIFFVHGYMGSWCDFRDLKNRLALRHLQDGRFIFVLCQTFYERARPELNLFEMGHFLALEALEQARQHSGSALEDLRSVSFVGFSMGNIVVQACVAAQAFAPLRSFLLKCFCINGPFSGLRPPSLPVALGGSCIRACSGHVCLGQVENAQIDITAATKAWAQLPRDAKSGTKARADTQAVSLAQADEHFEFLRADASSTGCYALLGAQPLAGYDFPRRASQCGEGGAAAFSGQQHDCLASDTTGDGDNMRWRSAGAFMGVGSSRLSALGTLDFMALFSHATLFEQIVLFGSRNDGYVAENSAMCVDDRGGHGLESWFVGCRNVRRYSIQSPAAKRRRGGCIDVVTGRTVHLMPLVDQQVMGTLCCIMGECFADLLDRE